MPQYTAKINVPGFHLHFISEDKTKGGHVLDFATDNPLIVELDKASGLIIEENTHTDWQNINLKTNREKDLKQVE
ncbi:Alpha-acetolactate decarboxylase [Thermoflexibacter ruber]|uniref:Alpha-acetolactate decarboxylase n=2 Tax=Thermoflexibacter ruber TaxID=1003 RepID=A0A1I2J942_9BACT|nr:Alpha-acetolactate decarboxylase [Thermoflexibacter ruber]